MSDNAPQKSSIVHTYDDIQEEDNHLPNWWLAILFGTMVFGFGYWLVYEVTHSLPNPPVEYHAAVAAVKKAQAEAAAKAAPPVAAKSDGPASIEAPKFEISTDPAAIEKGKATFAAKGCIACHTIGKGKLVGPDLKDVLKRRNQLWVERMILHPEVMLREDDTAKELFKVHMVPMANQNVDPVNELPFIVAYLNSEPK